MQCESFTDQGMRERMEDILVLQERFCDQADWVFGSVFDGHGGTEKVAETVADLLPKFFVKGLELGVPPEQNFVTSYEQTQTLIEKFGFSHGGSCAATFLLQDNLLTVANTGDSHIVVIDQKARRLKRLTVDDRMENAAERERMLEAGAFLKPPYYCPNRDSAGVMVSRCFGDPSIKPVGLIATPHTASLQLLSDDQFILAATDGLFDFLTDKEILECFKQHVSREKSQSFRVDLNAILQELHHNAKASVEGSSFLSDNIAMILVDVR